MFPDQEFIYAIKTNKASRRRKLIAITPTGHWRSSLKNGTPADGNGLSLLALILPRDAAMLSRSWES